MRRTRWKTLQQPRKKKRGIMYANIDWKKAESLFQQPAIQDDVKRQYPRVREILRVIAAAGAVGMIFLYPGTAPALAALLKLKRYHSWQMNQVIRQLRRQKYIAVIENEDGTTTVRITKSGLTRALTYELETMQILKPKRWDKKWRVVIFDVPEKYKELRDAFRVRLRQLGLKQLQESVYVSPYPCFDEVEFLRQLYGVAFTTRYLLVDQLENDKSLRIDFGISS